MVQVASSSLSRAGKRADPELPVTQIKSISSIFDYLQGQDKEVLYPDLQKELSSSRRTQGFVVTPNLSGAAWSHARSSPCGLVHLIYPSELRGRNGRASSPRSASNTDTQGFTKQCGTISDRLESRQSTSRIKTYLWHTAMHFELWFILEPLYPKSLILESCYQKIRDSYIPWYPPAAASNARKLK